jgi:hypothetical protein
MATETTLNPSESLKLISDVIIKTKEQYRQNSFYFLLWGWLIASASFCFFVLQYYLHFRYFFLPFPVLVSTGIAITLLRYFRQKALQPSETYGNFFISRLWLVLGISFIVVVFISLSLHLLPFLFMLIIAGIGTLVSGLSMRFKPLITGGVLFFAAALAGIFVPDSFKVLLFACAIIAGYLLPGYLLQIAKNR